MTPVRECSVLLGAGIFSPDHADQAVSGMLNRVQQQFRTSSSFQEMEAQGSKAAFFHLSWVSSSVNLAMILVGRRAY